MIEIRYSKKNTPFVYASELHKKLNIRTPLRKWFPRQTKFFEEEIDYFRVDRKVRAEKGGTQLAADWAIQLEMAKHISVMCNSSEGKAIRKYLLGLDDKVKDGKLLDRKQIIAIIDLIEVLGYFSVQVKLEQNHHSIFSKSENWWNYRARIFGQSASDLKDIMQKLGKKYKNQRQALLHIDKYELLRRASFDLFKAMGKSDVYSKNISTTVKEISKEMEPEIYDDRNMSISFKSEKQEATIRNLYSPKQRLIFS